MCEGPCLVCPADADVLTMLTARVRRGNPQFRSQGLDTPTVSHRQFGVALRHLGHEGLGSEDLAAEVRASDSLLFAGSDRDPKPHECSGHRIPLGADHRALSPQQAFVNKYIQGAVIGQNAASFNFLGSFGFRRCGSLSRSKSELTNAVALAVNS